MTDRILRALLVSPLLVWFWLPSVALAQGLPVPPQKGSPAWVVRQFLPVMDVPGHPGSQIRWGQPVRAGDWNGDGFPDLVATGEDPAGSSYFYLLGLGGPLRTESVISLPVNHSPLPNERTVAFQGTPGGVLVIVADLFFYPKRWRVFELQGGAFLGFLSLPPGPPALPSPALEEVRTVGDRNGDGYEELLLSLSGKDTISGAIHVLQVLADGRDLQPVRPIWVHDFLAGEASGLVWSTLVPYSTDLDGDGVGDFFTGSAPVPALGKGRSFGALSGVDGSMLWTYAEPQPNGFDPTWLSYSCPDLDDDGVRDLIALNLPNPQKQDLGRLYALSGSTGLLIWENLSFGRRLPYLDQPQGLQIKTRILDFGPVGDLDRDGKTDIALLAKVSYNSPPPSYGYRREITRVWLFSGADGSWLACEDWPLNLSPFFPEGIKFTNWEHPFGDLDGDGYTEWTALAFSDGSSPVSYLAVLGRRTLAAPDRTAPGAPLPLELDIPAGGSCPFHLLFSGGLDWQGGGYALGVWDTFLLPDGLLARSLLHPPLHGTLDPLGFGTVTLVVPPRPALAGRTFYARAWIEDAAVPGAVRTMSSLAAIAVE